MAHAELAGVLLALGALAPGAGPVPPVPASPPVPSGHPSTAAVALVKIDAGGGVHLTLRHDALAFALDERPARIADAPMVELLDGPDEVMTAAFADARERFAALFELLAGGRRIDVEILQSPATADVRAWERDHPDRRLPVRLDFVARAALPAGASSVSMRFPEVLGDVIVTVDHPGAEPIALPMRPGEATPEIALSLATPPDGGGAGSAWPPASLARPMGTLEAAWRYVEMGFKHIAPPKGWDHVLFVLGLFFLSPRAKALLWQVSAFTIAHSITLALTMLGLVELPPGVVEPTIAASIAFVAIENVATDRLRPWRPAVVFVFGLVHGLGFGGVLRETPLPRGQLATALVSFNVGVELGQLTVIAAALAAVGWWRQRAWYRRAIVVPASLSIAAVGVAWTVQRLI